MFPNYRLLMDLPDLTAGAIFYWDDEYGEYTNDHRSDRAYWFTKGVVSKQPQWFEPLTLANLRDQLDR